MSGSPRTEVTSFFFLFLFFIFFFSFVFWNFSNFWNFFGFFSSWKTRKKYKSTSWSTSQQKSKVSKLIGSGARIPDPNPGQHTNFGASKTMLFGISIKAQIFFFYFLPFPFPLAVLHSFRQNISFLDFDVKPLCRLPSPMVNNWDFSKNFPDCPEMFL